MKTSEKTSTKQGFTPGNPGNRGGGRHKEEFLIWCRKTASSPKARRFIEALVNGEPIEEKILDTAGGEPQKVMVSASPETRRRALADLWDRGYGKPPMATEDRNAIGDLILEITNYKK